MKQVINIGIGGRSFVIDEDAYAKLKKYLEEFRTHAKMGIQTKEVMDDLESRIAELFSEKLNSFQDVVNIGMVNLVIGQLGMPDGEPFEYKEDGERCSFKQGQTEPFYMPSLKKLYRDSMNKSIGGVCSGLSLYFGLDILLVRILFVFALLMGSAGFWAYIILWIAVPLANTPTQKCEMYGVPVTAENLRKFSNMR